MSLLLAIAGAVAPAPPQNVGFGGADWFSEPLRVKREPWREELDRLFAKPKKAKPLPPKPAVRRKPVEVGLTWEQRAYFDSLYDQISQAVKAQEVARQMAAVAQVEQEALAAIQMLQEAIAAEEAARRRMIDFDIVFVAAVLATM